MKIAIFTDTYLPQINGVSTTVDRFIKYLAEEGHEYLVVSPRYHRTDRRSKNHIYIRNMRLFFYKDVRLSFLTSTTVRKVIDRFAPDIVHTMNEFPISDAGIRYANRRNIPVISGFETNIPEYFAYYKLQRLTWLGWDYYKWFLSRSDLIVTPSSDTKDLLLDNSFQNVWVWERGIEFNRFSPENRDDTIREKFGGTDAFHVIYVGRLAKEKDLGVFIDAAVQLKKQYGNKVAFTIVGGGPMLEKLKQSSPEFINFTGFLTGLELHKMYASADAFLFPSPTETLGFVNLEAMASGVPVVACYSGGIKDILIDGYNGIKCREKQVDDYVAGVQTLIDDPALKKKMAGQAREYAKTKDWSRSFDTLINKYKEMIETKNKKSKKR